MPMPSVAEVAQEAPDLAVEITGLTKIYRGRRNGRATPLQALSGVDLAIPRGALFGLLGPNGAGKSTLINILAGLVLKTAGRATVWGFDLDHQGRQARSAIGVVPQELNIDPFFTPRELLELQAGMYGVPAARRRTDAILEAVGLAEQSNAYARSLSGGMRRRLMVAKAMVHSPPILVLDEPTAGVDVELRRQLWSHVRALNRAGTTILLTTHYLQEAQELCDTIAIIDRGTLVACEPTHTLLRRLDHKVLTLVLDRDFDSVPAALADHALERLDGRRLRWRYQPSTQPIDTVLEAVRAAGFGIVDLSSKESDLEEIFLQLTGSGADNGRKAGGGAAGGGHAGP